jgi:arylsulfatase
MSGRRPFEVGVTHTVLHRERMALDVTTFPQLLQSAGYKTALFGKWHLGDKGEYLPQKRGFDEVLMHGAGGIGQALGDFKVNRTDTYFNNVLLHNNTVVKTEGFCTDLFFTSALSWVKEQHEKKQPYFAYVSLNAPHAPAIAPEHYKRRFLNQGYDERSAARYGMIENIDDNFGHMMQQLKSWGALENTLVIFMTDNGMTMPAIKKKGSKRSKPFNAGMKGGKNSPWEGGSHVPSFWYWNGMLGENVDINALTSHIDLYRTFTDLAGVNIPESKLAPVGRSLIPLLENPEAAWPDRKIFVHKGRWDDGRKNKMTREENQYNGAAIRTEQWRLVYSLDKKGKVETFLSDVKKDPGETTNLVNKFPEVVNELKTAYDAWWHSTEPFLINDKLPKTKSKTKSFNDRYNEQLKDQGIPHWKPTLPIIDFSDARL